MEGSETILFLEDEEIVRSLVCSVLQAQGYAVLEAGSGPETLRISSAHKGPIHLMLTYCAPSVARSEILFSTSTTSVPLSC
jgi:CheY-like chemotaxis protein